MSGVRRRPRGSGRKRRVGARELALQVLVLAESRSAYSDRLLESRLKEAALSPEDARLVTALVQGTLRRRGTLDHHLSALTRNGIDELPAWIRGALRIGAFQLLYLDRIPPSAAVGESVELAKKYGHPGVAGLVNAVLRRLAAGARAPFPESDADPVAYLATARSHPRWLVERWIAQYGREEADHLLEADNAEPSVTVRPSLLRATSQEVLAALHEEGFSPQPGPNGGPVFALSGGFVPGRSRAFLDGLLSLQDEAESVVVGILDPKPGETILDVCAAPGGKASQVTEAVHPGGCVVALERHPSRVRALRQNLLERLRLHGVHVVCADGVRPPLRGPFDRVLVDAPCSGLGVLRRRADARWRKDAGTISAMAALQALLLLSAAALVRSGGAMVYSVCSLEPEETSGIVEPFLRDRPEFIVDDVNPFLPPAFRSREPTLRAMPHRHGTDGVYAARLIRR